MYWTLNSKLSLSELLTDAECLPIALVQLACFFVFFLSLDQGKVVYTYSTASVTLHQTSFI